MRRSQKQIQRQGCTATAAARQGGKEEEEEE
jgi:hypothetical protein